MKRFYKEVSCDACKDGFAVLLDKKQIRTPAGRELLLPVRDLAETIANEWQVQNKDIIPSTMPMMQMAATAIDRVGQNREEMTARLLSYADHDLLCHRAAYPQKLRQWQDSLWQPTLDWLRKRYDIHLNVTDTLVSVEQPLQSKECFAVIIDALDEWNFIGLQSTSLASGSLVLALALLEGELASEQVFEAAELETSWQIEVWGEDEELTSRRNSVKQELISISEWFRLIQSHQNQKKQLLA